MAATVTGGAAVDATAAAATVTGVTVTAAAATVTGVTVTAAAAGIAIGAVTGIRTAGIAVRATALR